MVAFIVFVALGFVVSPHPAGALDRAVAGALFGHATLVATLLTVAGLFPAYAFFGVVGIAIGLLRRALLPRAIVAVVALIVAWQVSDVFKVLFHRPRPAHWLWIHETSWSYPSGHAVNVLTFFGVWAGALTTARPGVARTVGLVAIAAWILAVGWSRIALGAHYLSDVAGGYLLAAAFVGIATAVQRYVFRDAAA